MLKWRHTRFRAANPARHLFEHGRTRDRHELLDERPLVPQEGGFVAAVR